MRMTRRTFLQGSLAATVATAVPPVAALYIIGVATKNQDLRDFVLGCGAAWVGESYPRKLVAYAFGTVALIIAAAASGWLAPAALRGGLNPQGEVTEIARALFRQSGHLNQAFAAIGFALVAAAIVLWSAALLRLRIARGLGIVGLVVGAVVLIGIGSGTGLPLHGFGGIAMLGQLVWMLWAGALLLRPASPE